MYYDRLVDSKDQVWLFELLQKMVKQHFKEDFSGVFRHLVRDGGSRVTDDDMRSLMFGDYMKPDAVGTCAAHVHTTVVECFSSPLPPSLPPSFSSSLPLHPSHPPFLPSSLLFLLPPPSPLPPQDVKLYEEVTSLEEFTSIVETSLEEYNNMHKNRMNLVIFRYNTSSSVDAPSLSSPLSHPLPLIPSLSSPPSHPSLSSPPSHPLPLIPSLSSPPLIPPSQSPSYFPSL